MLRDSSRGADDVHEGTGPAAAPRRFQPISYRELLLSIIVLGGLLVAATAATAQARSNEHWVATWATAQQLIAVSVPAVAPAAPPQARDVAGPAGRRVLPPRLGSVKNQTIRMVVRTSIGGRQLRIRLANAIGAAPVTIGAAHIGLRSEGSSVAAGSDRAITFMGRPAVTLPAGAVILSDEIKLTVGPLAELAISLYVPDEALAPTSHLFGLHTTYLADGDVSARADLGDARTTESYYWLSGLDVLSSQDSAVIVTYGDSLTDGDRSTPDGNKAYPSILAERLRANSRTSRVGVVNLGIAGNQLLRDGPLGASALVRFDRDVLSQPGAKWLICLVGINDIGALARPGSALTAADVIGGLQQIAERARSRDLMVVGGTMSPFEGWTTFSDAGERVRNEVNSWIRSSGTFDRVIDFDALLRDPLNPRRLRDGLKSDDNLHPNDAGYAAMAGAIDLGLFTR